MYEMKSAIIALGVRFCNMEACFYVGGTGAKLIPLTIQRERESICDNINLRSTEEKLTVQERWPN